MYHPHLLLQFQGGSVYPSGPFLLQFETETVYFGCPPPTGPPHGGTTCVSSPHTTSPRTHEAPFLPADLPPCRGGPPGRPLRGWGGHKRSAT